MISVMLTISHVVMLSGMAQSSFNPIRSGGALKAPPPLRFFALTHLILELHYCALVTFPKNSLTPCGKKKFLIWGHDLAVRGSQNIKLT